MVLFVMGGLVGWCSHYRGSTEFQLEVNPDLSGLELFFKASGESTARLGPGANDTLGSGGSGLCHRYPISSARPGGNNKHRRMR